MSDSAYKSPGEIKQLVLRIYNSVNQAVSGVGVRQQRIDILGDRILVAAEHQRIPALSALDDTRRRLTREVDVAIVDLFKDLLRDQLERELGIGIRTILKDYDPATQWACTLILLTSDLQVRDGSRRPPNRAANRIEPNAVVPDAKMPTKVDLDYPEDGNLL